MKIWVGVTDKSWYEHFVRFTPDEANFWQPSGSRTLRALQPGEPFLFKLHSPDNFIVGGGFFVRYSALPASLACDAFERRKCVASSEAERRCGVMFARREESCATCHNSGAPPDGD
jgi:putative restriction endonuclease